MPADWETRRGERKLVSVQVRVRINPAMQETIRLAKEAIEATTVDISVHGVGLVSPIFLPPGAVIDLEVPRSAFSLPGKPSAEGSMKVTGKIVYAKPQGSQCRFGVSITEIAELDQRLIQEFIATQDRRREPRLPL